MEFAAQKVAEYAVYTSDMCHKTGKGLSHTFPVVIVIQLSRLLLHFEFLLIE